MNGRNRHKRYKRQVYARHGIFTVLVTVAITLAAVILALFIIGNILHAQSLKRNSYVEGEETESEETVDTSEKREVSDINGYHVWLETNDSTVFYDRVSALTSESKTHISISLNTVGGALLYKSQIAAEIGYAQANISLSEALSSISELGVYVSGVYYVNAFSEEDPLVRSVKLSRDAAAVSEALNSGIDDIVLVIPQMTDAHIDEAIRFAESIRALTKSGAIGLTVSNEILNGEDPSTSINKLDKSLDFLAVDLSEYGEIAPAEYINESINSGILIYLHMYKMRLLLPYSSDSAAQEEIIAAARDNGMSRWQIINKIQ